MPGYKVERFENLSENDRDIYSCKLCKNILCNPFVAQCCQQLFCQDCINDCNKRSEYCDNCSETMNVSFSPRILLDMLGELKIHCDFNVNGCKEVLSLKNLAKHIVKCPFNVETCEKCLCEIQDKSSHDCIKTLLELNRKGKEELESLKTSAKLISPIVVQTIKELAQTNSREEALQNEIGEMKIEREKNLKLIQKLKEKEAIKRSYIE